MEEWQAMREFVRFAESEHPELRSRTVSAHAFWTKNGTSVIPASRDQFLGKNYWSTYSLRVLNASLMFEDSEQPSKDSAYASYFATPSGVPVSLLYTENIQSGSSDITLIASRPVSGVLFVQFADGESGRADARHWSCDSHCTIHWTYDRPIQTPSISFCTSDLGPRRLLNQFFQVPGAVYGFPVGTKGTYVCFGAVTEHLDDKRQDLSSASPEWSYPEFDAKADWKRSTVNSTRMLQGSYPIEKDGTCWIGETASIYLKPPIAESIQVTGYAPVSAHRTAHPSTEQLTIEVYLNGVKAASLTEDQDTAFALTVPVSPGLRRRVINLELRVSDVFNPSQSGQGTDQRDLGVVIGSIRPLG